MTFHALHVAADDDGFGGNGLCPTLGFIHQGTPHAAPSLPGRNNQPGDFDAESGLDDVRGVSLQPPDDNIARIQGDNDQIGIRISHGPQPDGNHSGFRVVAQGRGKLCDGGCISCHSTTDGDGFHVHLLLRNIPVAKICREFNWRIFQRQDAEAQSGPLLFAYWMPSNSTSNTSVLFGGIAGLGLFAP